MGQPPPLPSSPGPDIGTKRPGAGGPVSPSPPSSRSPLSAATGGCRPGRRDGSMSFPSRAEGAAADRSSESCRWGVVLRRGTAGTGGSSGRLPARTRRATASMCLDNARHLESNANIQPQLRPDFFHLNLLPSCRPMLAFTDGAILKRRSCQAPDKPGGRMDIRPSATLWGGSIFPPNHGIHPPPLPLIPLPDPACGVKMGENAILQVQI